MAISSGAINLGKLLGGWVLGLSLTAFGAMHFDEIRSTLGLKLEAGDFGVLAEQEKPEPEVREVIRYVERPADDRNAQGRSSQRTSRNRQGADQLFTTSVQLERGYGGHFHADASINGRTIAVLVDTGATLVAMSYEDAMAAGVSVRPSDFVHVSNTANGQARFARVTLDEVRIGNVSVRNVAAAVGQPGKLNNTLLGMSFLGKVRMEMQAGKLVLEQ